MVDDFSAGQQIGDAIGGAIQRRRFNNALSSGDLERAARIDPQAAAQQQALRQREAQFASAAEEAEAARQQRAAQNAFRMVEAAKRQGIPAADVLGRLPEAARGALGVDDATLAQFAQAIDADEANLDIIRESLFGPAGGPELRVVGNSIARLTPGQDPEFFTPPQQEKPLSDLDRATIDLRRAQAAAARARAGGNGASTLEQERIEGQRLQNQLRQRDLDLSPGQKKLDQAFADEFLAFTQNGAASAAANLERLDDAKARLRADPGLTGPVVGSIPIGVRGVIAPESAAVQQQVEEVVQQSLRAILGGQFAMREGEQLTAREFNPQLPAEENVRRIDRIAAVIREAANAKAAQVRYFEENGTLKGFRGRVPSMEDIRSAIRGVVSDTSSGQPLRRVRFNPATGQLEDVQ